MQPPASATEVENNNGDDDERLCGEQPTLRGLILLTSIFLLSLGGIIVVFASAGLLNFMTLELQQFASLLKVPTDLLDSNLNWVYKVLGATGYATANIGALAVCAASGRRRAHSMTAAVTSGAVAVLYMAVLMAAVKPRIERVTEAIIVQQRRYFRAYAVTGDERYISQIHLKNGCCGLQKGAKDFIKWGRPTLPSSCCGQMSGNCTAAAARKLTCSQAVRDLSGSDGLMGLGYFFWVLGGTCAALSGLMILLLVSAGQDTIELLLSFRQRAEDNWRLQKQRESPEQRPLGLISHLVRLFDTKKQKNRDRELHRMLTKAAVDRKRAAAAGWKKMHPAQKMPFRTSFQGTLKRGNLCIATRALRMLSKTS